MRPQTGKVKNQARTSSFATRQLTADHPRVVPAPMIAVVIVWVVLKGTPKLEANKMETAAAVCAANP